MNSTEWLLRSVQSVSKGLQFKRSDPAATTPTKVSRSATAAVSAVAITEPVKSNGRSTRERLKAVLKHKEEALSPRVLRRTLLELQAVVDSQVSEVEGGRRARNIATWYANAPPEQRRDAWLLMSEQFAPNAEKIQAARDHYQASLGTPEEGQAEIRLRRAFVSPRTRLLQRFSAFPEGMKFLVDLRAELLPHLKTEKRLLALDSELENLFSTWFDVAFLELRRISWDSPASLIEKLIKYEAVHAIKGWADVKNRLDSDRRCYGFFHPRLPDEPLIFVEVALVDELAGAITPLLDESAAASVISAPPPPPFFTPSAARKQVCAASALVTR